MRVICEVNVIIISKTHRYIFVADVRVRVELIKQKYSYSYGSKKEGREEGQEGCEEEGDEKAPLIASQKQPRKGLFLYGGKSGIELDSKPP